MGKPVSAISLIPSDPAPEALAMERWADLNPFQQRLARQICDGLGLHDGPSTPEISRRADAAIATLREIAPRTELEGMLVVQMVLAHHAALASYQPSARLGAPTASQEGLHRRAQPWMTLYLQQLEALDRHRSRSQPPAPEPLEGSLDRVQADFEELLGEHLGRASSEGRTEVA